MTQHAYPTRNHPRNLHTVLPSGSTALEHDLVDAYDAQPVPVVIPTLKDPDTIPAPLLPYAAYERSVDTWSDNWPESTKRAMLKTARLIQARKGTVWAVREVLKAMGQGASQIIERVSGRRWDDGVHWDDRYQWDGHWATFAIILAQPVTAAHGKLIIEAISAVKPARCHLIRLDLTANPLRWDAQYEWDTNYTWDTIEA
jgi:phage tail P2-like protein